ncbi:MAG TPA: LysR substrate-binding domain-containing protein [Anaeromyxobacteraceae bacterium]|nr:LysR substrate-binding domain-containing protein [Anaeromyxobacteraceae bacterium]
MRATPHPFTLRQLQYALAVAELKSFRRAAERCHVSQPSLSAQVMQLEDHLGLRLFERGGRRVLVTVAGEAVLARLRRLLLEADDLADSARQLGDPLSGTLRVGVIPTVSPYLLPDVVPALRENHPDLSAVWVEDKTENLVASLREGKLDAALLALEAPVGDVEKEVVAEDPFVLAAPPGHALARGRAPATPQELRGAGFLLLDDGHCFREQALAYCSSARARELDFRATSLATLSQMVAGGAGVTLLPRIALPVENRRSELVVRRLSPEPHRTLALVWRPRSPLGPALRQLAHTLREACERSEPRLRRLVEPDEAQRGQGSAASRTERKRAPRGQRG